MGVAAVWLATAGCAATGPELVPRHPWIEDPTMALVDEQLKIDVASGQVQVEARFTFRWRADPGDRVLTFPVPPPCDAPSGFVATLEGAGRAAVRLHANPSDEPSSVPMGPIVERWDVHVPGDQLEDHGGVLVVRYAQRCTDAFRYTLLSGAYWAGPIGELNVRILDPDQRILSATVEKQPPHRFRTSTRAWSFRGLEPRGGVVLSLRPPSPDN
jgi:hypothetical protein